MHRCPTLLTDRLELRPFEERDVRPYVAVLAAPEVRAALRLPDPGPGDGEPVREEAWTQMALWLGQWELRGTGQWAVVERATGTFVGRAGLHRPERADWPGVEVGWALHPRFWGRGYATEAGHRAIGYGFGELGESDLYSVILPDNHRSQAVARRLGFALVDERILGHFPSEPHGIWHLSAPASIASTDPIGR